MEQILKGHRWQPTSWNNNAVVEIGVDGQEEGFLKINLRATSGDFEGIPLVWWQEVSLAEAGDHLRQFLLEQAAWVEEHVGTSLQFEPLPLWLTAVLAEDLEAWSLEAYENAIATLEASGSARRDPKECQSQFC
ncbi:hypothetical protein [Rhizobium jaguaris]|uniref:hypothetical protein n=1 Tax=Rhizobium jaguaris TaxID=1312183 RepID=UPI0013C51FB1|nr:hypothetical protein [Rhizobium jaguaris]